MFLRRVGIYLRHLIPDSTIRRIVRRQREMHRVGINTGTKAPRDMPIYWCYIIDRQLVRCVGTPRERGVYLLTRTLAVLSAV